MKATPNKPDYLVQGQINVSDLTFEGRGILKTNSWKRLSEKKMYTS